MAHKHLKSLLLSLLILCSTSAFSQTQADIELGTLVNNGDLFQLKAQYPALKDSVSFDMLRLIAEAQLGIGFNRLEEADKALEQLLQHHSEEIGPEAAISMDALRAMNLLNMGRYRQAAEAAEQLVEALKESVPFESLYSFVFIQRVGEAFAQLPAPYLTRPSHEVRVPMRVGAVGRGHHLYIPVEVNGVTRDYIFDTGCSFGNFVSEKYAEEVGLKIVADSIPVSGMTVGLVKLATADSMKIGEITYHNPIFMVAPPDPQVDSLFAFDGVLGYHFIRDAREIIIDNESQEFIFPAEISAKESNMYLESNTPHVRIQYQGVPFDITFDTGNVKTDLGAAFLAMFPDAISGLSEQSSQRGGFGGISKTTTVTLPEFNCTLAGVPVTLHDTEVIIPDSDNQSQLFHGALGADFVLSFKRFTINYQNMFVEGE
ncbi:aspartyl protease family protein [uncultured Alistipes sp.]|uniref:aspartyl protease family protein n=1 Tax=uncultured Alistipes sp. TaxID=538949 RepID=UPI002631FE94|nr:aspartyl protease family protein [uncultured Alistipes sp.]